MSSFWPNHPSRPTQILLSFPVATVGPFGLVAQQALWPFFLLRQSQAGIGAAIGRSGTATVSASDHLLRTDMDAG
jgi:hypothetical protein